MSPKVLIYIGMTIGGYVGGYIPTLWGDGYLSMSSIFLSLIGGIAGIFIGFKVSRMF